MWKSENKSTEVTIGGEILNSDLSLHKAYFWIIAPNSKQLGQMDWKT